MHRTSSTYSRWTFVRRRVIALAVLGMFTAAAAGIAQADGGGTASPSSTGSATAGQSVPQRSATPSPTLPGASVQSLPAGPILPVCSGVPGSVSCSLR